jgi:hypothetical protein
MGNTSSAPCCIVQTESKLEIRNNEFSLLASIQLPHEVENLFLLRPNIVLGARQSPTTESIIINLTSHEIQTTNIDKSVIGCLNENTVILKGKEIRVFDINSSETYCQGSLKYSQYVVSVDERTFISVVSKALYVWDLHQGVTSQHYTLEKDIKQVRAVDHRRIAILTTASLNVWNISSNQKLVCSFAGDSDRRVGVFTFARDCYVCVYPDNTFVVNHDMTIRHVINVDISDEIINVEMLNSSTAILLTTFDIHVIDVVQGIVVAGYKTTIPGTTIREMITYIEYGYHQVQRLTNETFIVREMVQKYFSDPTYVCVFQFKNGKLQKLSTVRGNYNTSIVNLEYNRSRHFESWTADRHSTKSYADVEIVLQS